MWQTRLAQFRLRATYATAADQQKMNKPIAQSVAHANPSLGNICGGFTGNESSHESAKLETKKPPITPIFRPVDNSVITRSDNSSIHQ
jgi:hypothetical protein